MKLDSGDTFYQSSITQETSPKTVQYNENPVENRTVKTGNDFRGKTKQEIAAFTQTEHFESDTDPLPSEKCDEDSSGYASGLHTHTASEDTVSGTANGTGNVVAAYYNPFETSYTNPFEDDTYFITDKSVTDIDLPELTSSYKDSSYYEVKDICIDMGVPSLDKILEEYDGMDQKGVIALPHLDLDEKGDLKRDGVSSTIPVSNSFDALLFDGRPYPGEDEVAANNGMPEKPLIKWAGIADTKHEISSKVHDEKFAADKLPLIGSAEPVSDVLIPLVSGSQNPRSLPEDHSKADSTCRYAKNSCDEEVVVKTSQFLHQSAAGNCQFCCSPSTDDKDQQLSAQDYVQCTTDVVAVKPEDASEDAHASTSVAPPATTVPSSTNNASDFPFDRTVESGSITFNFDSSPPPVISSRKVGPESSDFQQSGRSLNVPGLDDSLLDSLTGSTRSFFIQHGLGDSSISGPIPYSGNISLRSDSSTASTRSFAFPVLHSEWNSSPVKMAKPDRRQLRKHRGWRVVLLCCRF